MATVYTDEYQNAFVDEPSVKLDVTKQHGRVRRMYASITLAAELSVSDIIAIGKLPKGARVCDARAIAPVDGGGTPAGIANIGWAANGSDAADADGLFIGASEFDFGAGAIDNKLLGTAAGYNKKFAEETEIQAVVTEASAGSTGNVLEFEVFYVLD